MIIAKKTVLFANWMTALSVVYDAGSVTIMGYHTARLPRSDQKTWKSLRCLRPCLLKSRMVLVEKKALKISTTDDEDQFV